MTRLPDGDLTVLVEASARGLAEKAEFNYDEMPGSAKNALREQALPFIFHGTKALADLGYRKPRQLFRPLEVLATDARAVILAEGDKTGEGIGDLVLHWRNGRLTNGQITYFTMGELIEDYDRVAVLWEPKP